LFVVGVVVAVAVAGCASSGHAGVVARFRGWQLSVGSLTHWIAIEAVLERDLYPQQAPPPGMVPDPPKFSACVGYERASWPPTVVGKPAPTRQQLLQACRARYEQIREHILQLLISYQWMQAETRAHHILVSELDVQRAYVGVEHGAPWRTTTEFAKYLHATGETPADERKIVRFDLEDSALEEQTLHEHGIPGLRKLLRQFPRELKAQTNCSPGYVITECKQYKGSQPPEA
jgi:foldase protein PrsA